MKFKKALKHPIQSFKRTLTRFRLRLTCFRCVSDKSAICKQYKLSMKKKLNLDNPKTFNEKLNWIKLYYRKPLFIDMVDKYNVKQLVSNKIGEEYVIPSIGVYKKWDEIDFSKIEAPFVIKTTHSSGCIAVIKEKNERVLESTKKKMNRSLRTNYFYHCREWAYKNVEPRIIIEKFVKDEKEDNLPVFKFFCFDGEPYLVQTIKNDKTKYETIDYFDMDWKLLNLRQNFNNSDIPLDKPRNFGEMKKIAAQLSKGFPFIRVDLYSVNGKVFFSEFTFFSDAGYQRFYPDEWDYILGEKIKLDLNEKYC